MSLLYTIPAHLVYLYTIALTIPSCCTVPENL